ncbi:MAG: NADH:flavin oxidoreductase/NADH oxidase [Candidatus Eremiobacteraeota bacterium]|nr:NADH:flavin oxidoreductase/NADH oxidase [Candidatus Eremiobacteraeota bacterium]
MSKLFEPIALRDVELENRVVVSPMCQYSSEEGNANDWHVVNLGHFALSGPGLAFFEATHVSPEGRITAADLGLYSDDNEEAMSRVVAFMRRWTHTKVGVQLAHAGRKGSTLPPWEGGGPALGAAAYQTVAPSAIPYADWRAPQALDAAGLQKVRDDFVTAAKRCERLGIDVVELHFAHGYLAHQFLSPLSNAREDEYGGTLENRLRFPLELFSAVRAVWPVGKPLGVRISATDWVEGGWDVAQSIELVRELRNRGCDFVDVSSGGLSPEQKITAGPGYQVPFAAEIRRATGLLTMAVGMITEPAQAETILRSGEADFIVLARGFIRNPQWTWDAADSLGGTPFVPQQYARGRNRH